MKRSESLPYRTQIEAIIKRAMAEKTYRAYLFGSRVTDSHNLNSDIDIAILAEETVDLELSLARELLAESNIPFTVDLVNMNQTSPSFRAQALQEGLLLWTS
jgi:predicted nucleotidyltransferase